MGTRGRAWFRLGHVALVMPRGFRLGLQIHFNVFFMSGNVVIGSSGSCFLGLGLVCLGQILLIKYF